MTASGTTRTEERLRTQGRISAEIRRFDLPSLLTLLSHLGWSLGEIRFRSVPASHSQPALLESIEFSEDPRWVLVTTNMGLLSAQSPLPSYFFQRMESGLIDGDAFADFVAYFDNAVIAGLLRAAAPEWDPVLSPGGPWVRPRELLLLDLRSCATLHWLFASVFPELEILVDKAGMQRTAKTGEVVLGEARLGAESVFGGVTRLPTAGTRVLLTADTERAGSGRSWPGEVRQRLDDVVFPILEAVGADLQVDLEIRAKERWATLGEGSALGYDRLRAEQSNYRRIRMFQGTVAR